MPEPSFYIRVATAVTMVSEGPRMTQHIPERTVVPKRSKTTWNEMRFIYESWYR